MQAVKMVGVLEAEPLPPRPSLGSAHVQVNSAHGHTARKTRAGKRVQFVQTRTGRSAPYYNYNYNPLFLSNVLVHMIEVKILLIY